MLRGSPPLARGVRKYLTTGDNLQGITPACAGSTHCVMAGYESYEDHPRLRGEYSFYQSVLLVVPGSPPLARGVLASIPPIGGGGVDHPRLRGEY